MAAIYSPMSVSELEAELNSRKFRIDGNKGDLVRRLRDADWEDWMQQNDPFSPFPRFPVEIQRYIWKLSLPGPRILSVHHKHDTEKLCFPKEHHTPNPAALTTCRISRDVALSRYRPVFGNAHVYADLQGGDMVYFGPWHEDLDMDEFWSWYGWEVNDDRDVDTFYRLSPTVVADLEQIVHMVLNVDFLDRYLPENFGEDEEYSGGLRLRRDLKQFKSLKMVSLCYGGSDQFQYSCPGQVALEVNGDNFEDDPEYKWALELLMENFQIRLSKEEKLKGIPEVQMVEAHRISDPQHCRESRFWRIAYPI
jgi:hypothetical protein